MRLKKCTSPPGGAACDATQGQAAPQVAWQRRRAWPERSQAAGWQGAPPPKVLSETIALCCTRLLARARLHALDCVASKLAWLWTGVARESWLRAQASSTALGIVVVTSIALARLEA